MKNLLIRASSYPETCSRIEALKSGIFTCYEAGMDLALLESQLSDFSRDEQLGTAEETMELREKFRCNVSAVRLPEREALEMMASCDRLRFRMLAMAVSACQAGTKFKPAEEAELRLEAIVRGRGGVTHAVCGRQLIVLLPELGSNRDCDRAAQDLMAVYESPRRRGMDWLVDFSSVLRVPSFLLFGSLTAYLRQLECERAALKILWLRCGLLTPGLVSMLEPVFHLRKIGAHLFSVPPGGREE